MQSQWSLQDAKNKFSELVNAANGGAPQVVTKRGVPSVVVLSVSAYERLLAQGKTPAPRFADFLLAMPEVPEDNGKPDLSLREVEF